MYFSLLSKRRLEFASRTGWLMNSVYRMNTFRISPLHSSLLALLRVQHRNSVDKYPLDCSRHFLYPRCISVAVVALARRLASLRIRVDFNGFSFIFRTTSRIFLRFVFSQSLRRRIALTTHSARLGRFAVPPSGLCFRPFVLRLSRRGELGVDCGVFKFGFALGIAHDTDYIILFIRGSNGLRANFTLATCESE